MVRETMDVQYNPMTLKAHSNSNIDMHKTLGLVINEEGKRECFSLMVFI